MKFGVFAMATAAAHEKEWAAAAHYGPPPCLAGEQSRTINQLFEFCTSGCSVDSDCPVDVPQIGNVSAPSCQGLGKDVDRTRRCVLKCSSDSDCVEGTTCSYQVSSDERWCAHQLPVPTAGHYGQPPCLKDETELVLDEANASMCGAECTDASDCPMDVPPARQSGSASTPACEKWGQTSKCVLKCSTNMDCTDGATCIAWNATEAWCMYVTPDSDTTKSHVIV